MDLFKMFSSKPSSKDVAKERLKLILIHDRSSISPEVLESIKEDILKVLSKYMEIDNGEIDVKMTKMEELEGDSPALIASIPVKRMKVDK
ncbi:cell division topological specificity factor MinE [Clostridium carboxidivorans P7]|uniref:Cell division topological specificity factor n=1 Tax=Clostridium carboxidivorans P7 TaxID=536227 RepID=C6PYL9_9CLOT|nr:cell division topological specificity factor MinE [Clostridium carboxidivorans]AKN32276.1 cell division topological specificity factor MinE [Clostridium carboxidivorans P7]EET85652.1 cell division topological specificity factor MinE [Clostridium carboxidivorans P7]